MNKIYLDNAATTQLRGKVLVRMQDSLANFYGNPSSTHSYGRSAKTEIEKARKTIAKAMNAHPSEIIFTSGGTEADNMVLRAAVRDLKVKTIITSKIEHHAVLHSVEVMEEEYGVQLQFVNLDAFGNPDVAHLKILLQQDNTKKLVTLMHINNEIGNKTDIEAVGALCKANNALFHSDTVQSVGHYPWDVQSVAIDFLTAAAHKFHGPKGVGFVYIKRNSGIKPLIVGGSQERGFRAGTEACHSIVGMEEAFVIANANMASEKEYIEGLKSYFIKNLKKVLPAVTFNGHSGDIEKSTYTLVNVCLPFDEQKSLMLLFHLDIKGIACSKGSACQSGSNLGSHVLNEILSDEDLKKPSLRFSFSKYNTKEELDYVIEVLKEFAEG